MPTPSIQKVVVIGSGSIGSQIAAQLANGGIPVLLLDMAPPDSDDRNALARNAVEQMLKAKPSPFMHPRHVQLVTFGNIEDDFGKLREADWIIEVMAEDINVKADLYGKINKCRKKRSIVSSGTSFFSLASLLEGQPEVFVQDFIITHFFTPLRANRLVEIVSGDETRSGLVAAVADFCDRKMGKKVVLAHDSPGLIANRLDFFFIQAVLNATHEFGLRIEEADAAFDRICKEPYAYIDRMGLDMWSALAKNQAWSLPQQDLFSQTYHEQPLFHQMVRAGYSGQKGKGGFYRIKRSGAETSVETLNLQTGAYAALQQAELPVFSLGERSLRDLSDSDTPIGQVVWRVLSQVLSYAATLVLAVANDIVAIDTAMRLGAGWRLGPFELIDKIGVDWFMAHLREKGRPIPAFLLKAAGRTFYRVYEGKREYLTIEGDYAPIPVPRGILQLSDVRCAAPPVAQNENAQVWDIGDGVLCFEFLTKMNSFSPAVLELLDETLTAIAEDDHWKGLVIYNDSEPFSAGANLKVLLSFIDARDWDGAKAFVETGSRVFNKMRMASFPTVVAVSGYAVGGGCELLLHASAVQAFAETMIGLPEVRVGLIPGWDGCLQLLGRVMAARKQFGGDVPPVNYVFEAVAQSKISKSAAEAMDLHFLRPSDGISMNRDRLLSDAKDRLLYLAKNYEKAEPWKLSFSGAVGRAASELVLEGFKVSGVFSDYDVTVGRALAAMLCGSEGDPVGPITEDQMRETTRREFMRLFQQPETRARIEHMLKTGQTLKN